MIRSNIKITINVPVAEVWQKVLDFAHQEWRSDLTCSEILGENSFLEIAKNGTKTEFEVSFIKQNQRLELCFDNDYISGEWLGLFFDQGAHTTLGFTEMVSCKKWWLRPFVGKQLQSMQKQYMRDLLKVLGVNELSKVLRIQDR